MRVEDIKPGVRIKLKSNLGWQFTIVDSFVSKAGKACWRIKDNSNGNIIYAEKEEALEKYYDLVEEKKTSLFSDFVTTHFWTSEEPEAQIEKKDEKHKCRCDWNDLLRDGCQCGGS